MSTLTDAATVRAPVALGRFALHFIEMCAVMCIGGLLLDAAIFSGLAVIGFADLAADAPATAMLILTVDFVAVMAGYMALRHHPVRHNLEMSGSTAVAGVLLIAASSLGWFAQGGPPNWYSLFAIMCGPLCLLMLVVMLVRFDHYGGGIGSPPAAAD